MHRFFSIIIVLGGLLTAFSLDGCNIINRKEALPFFISLPTPTIVDNNTENRQQQGAKVVWIETGNDSIGFIPVPNTIPIIPKDTKKYLFLGGVSELGQGFVGIYPFWKPVSRIIDTPPVDTLKMDSLVFYYYSDTVLAYPFMEAFENASIKFKKIAGSQVDIVADATTKFEGTFGGKAVFNNVLTQMNLLADVDAFYLPYNNPAYLEITYKGDVSFYAGLHHELFGSGTSSEVPYAAFINASPDKWNTVYLRLNNLMAKLDPNVMQNSNYKIFLKAEGDGGNHQLFLDNVRVIYKR